MILSAAAAGVALLAAAFVLLGAVKGNQQGTSQAKLDAATAQALGEQIQRERIRNIRDACEAQNIKHNAAVDQIATEIAKLPALDQAAARKSQAGTVRIIETIVPLRNCDDVVSSQVGTRTR